MFTPTCLKGILKILKVENTKAPRSSTLGPSAPSQAVGVQARLSRIPASAGARVGHGCPQPLLVCSGAPAGENEQGGRGQCGLRSLRNPSAVRGGMRPLSDQEASGSHHLGTGKSARGAMTCSNGQKNTSHTPPRGPRCKESKQRTAAFDPEAGSRGGWGGTEQRGFWQAGSEKPTRCVKGTLSAPRSHTFPYAPGGGAGEGGTHTQCHTHSLTHTLTAPGSTCKEMPQPKPETSG